jgi:PAS domain S-box-containing protein
MISTEPIAQAATRPSSDWERIVAFGVTLGLIGVAVSRSLLHRAAPSSPQLFAAYLTALALSALFAATLLIFRARLVSDGPSAFIASTVTFTVPLIAGCALSSPGAGAPWLAHPEASAWMGFAWRAGFALAICWYARARATTRVRLGRAVAVALGASAVIVVLAFSGLLPALQLAGAGTISLADGIANGIVIACGLSALFLLLRSHPLTTLDTWVAVALAVLLSGNILVAATGAQPASIVGALRITNLGAYIVLIGALLSEFARLLKRSTAFERFMTMAQHAATIVYLLDAHGSCVFVNNRWCELTGQSLESALEQGWNAIIHPDDFEHCRRVWEVGLAAGVEHQVELRYRCADGSYRWHLAIATPSFNAAGVVDGWYGSATDVDSQHRALDEAIRLQREAAERESDVRRIAETIPLMAWTADSDGLVEWYNERWYRYTGQSSNEALGFGWAALVHPDDLPETARRWKVSIRTGTAFEFEYRLRGKDRRYRWFLTRALPITDDDGAVIKWYGTSTDTDETRRQADHFAELYAREHEIAQTLQSAFIPPFLPRVDGLDFQAVYRPALRETELGGDWYDVFVLRDGRVALSIGDIAGHGIDAAIAMVRLRETLRAVAGFIEADPGTILQMADRAFMATYPEKIATAAFALYDPATRHLVYARAGHPPAALVRDGEVTFLASDAGVPLGVENDSVFQSEALTLQPGDTLYFYTDGLLEMSRDLIAGERRFASVLQTCGADIERIVDTTLEDGQRDDVAILGLSVVGSTSQASWHFESDDASTAVEARYAFVAHLRGRGCERDLIQAAELVFGELVGNVVRHSPGAIEIELLAREERLFLVVRDRGAPFDIGAIALPDDPFAEGGRGMYILSCIASPPIVVPRFGGGNEVIVALPVAKGGLAASDADADDADTDAVAVSV